MAQPGQLDPATQALVAQLLQAEASQFVGPPSAGAGPDPRMTRVQPSTSLSNDTSPTRDLGGTDQLLNILSTLLGGQSQQGFIEQGQQDFPGLNAFSDAAQTQHLASTGTAVPLIGQTATSAGGGLIEIIENLLQGTNTAERPRAVEDTTLDFLANQLGASGVDPKIAVDAMNILQQQLQGASPEEQFAIQDKIAPIQGPLSRALVNPGTITTSPIQGLLSATGADEGLDSLLQTLSSLFGVQGSRAGESPKGTQTTSGPRG